MQLLTDVCAAGLKKAFTGGLECLHDAYMLRKPANPDASGSSRLKSRRADGAVGHEVHNGHMEMH